MEDLSEAALGWERIQALMERDRVSYYLISRAHPRHADIEFWLAVLGWTPAEFLMEAYPELYGGSRG
jgi:hypothetical protein